jgi:hypothetical protein
MTGVYTIPAVASTLPNENIRTPLRTVADHLEKTRSILDLSDVNDESSGTDSESTERANFKKCTENKFHRDLNNYILCLTDLIPTLEEGLREVDLAGRIQEDQADAIIFHVTEAATCTCTMQMINLCGQDIAKTFYEEKELISWHTPSNLFDGFDLFLCKYLLWYVQTVRYRTIATALPMLPTLVLVAYQCYRPLRTIVLVKCEYWAPLSDQ